MGCEELFEDHRSMKVMGFDKGNNIKVVGNEGKNLLKNH